MGVASGRIVLHPRAMAFSRCFGAGFLSAFLVAGPSSARVVERVVAVVADQPVLLSDVRERAKVVLGRLAAAAMSEPQRASAEGQILHEAVQRVVDERLMTLAAEKAHLAVTEQEVDNALKYRATASHVTLIELLSEAKKQGLSEDDYRAELRRQLLEGKLVQLRLGKRVRVSDDDARAAYGRFVRELSAEPLVDVGLIALRVKADLSDADKDKRLKLAEELSTSAATGGDFCKMASELSDDVETRATCGSRGPQPLSAFAGELKDRLSAMKIGQVSEPFVLGDALVILKVRDKPGVPEFESVKEQMMERAYSESMEKQRKSWLGELRRETYVDVRM